MSEQRDNRDRDDNLCGEGHTHSHEHGDLRGLDPTTESRVDRATGDEQAAANRAADPPA